MASPADLAACRQMIREGSKTFFTASLLLPARIRDAARQLYAFCRVADDLVDQSAGGSAAIAELQGRLDAIYAGKPRDIADAYLAQLLLCASATTEPECEGDANEWPASRIVDEHVKPLCLRRVPVVQARACLVDIARLCAAAQRAPVPLCVDTAQEWMTDHSLSAAHSEWGADDEPFDFAGDPTRSERYQEEMRLLWGDRDTPPDGWQRCAESVYALLADVLPRNNKKASAVDDNSESSTGDPDAGDDGEVERT